MIMLQLCHAPMVSIIHTKIIVMEKRELCADVCSSLFGPATGRLVETSTDSDDVIVEKCKAKIATFFGTERAELFVGYVNNPTEELKAKIVVK
jgi:hypothetical protein